MGTNDHRFYEVDKRIRFYSENVHSYISCQIILSRMLLATIDARIIVKNVPKGQVLLHKHNNTSTYLCFYLQYSEAVDQYQA